MRCILFALALLPVQSWSQEQVRTLKGFLGVEGGESFSYRLEFTESEGELEGYAYTWLHEGKEVKAKITGKLDRATRRLSFRETEILYNKGFESTAVICLIDAELTYQKDESGAGRFAGPITSSYAGNVHCGNGTVSFPDDEIMRSMFQETAASSPAPEKTAVVSRPSRPVRIVYDTARPPQRAVAQPQAGATEGVTVGQDKELVWQSGTVILELWDRKVDGDRVSVYHNGRQVLSNFALSGEKKVLELKLEQDVDIISIQAGNTGSEPPNTADLILRDGKKEYPLIAYNETGRKAIIKIRRNR